MSKIKEKDLVGIAQLYNNEGRQAAYDFISKQGIKYPYAIVKRMKSNPKLMYNKDIDSFTLENKARSNDVFMSMEELCSPVSTQLKPQKVDDRKEAMEKLIQDLLGDRLLELSKYITIETSSKTMMIDQTSLKSAGYKVVTH